ncbi:MAG: GNAT family N-acetyltransferase [Candidatus Promineifilaceae bacterium]
MALEFKRLTEVDKAGTIELMNNPLVRRQMPLTSDEFDEADCEAFSAAKERLWDEHGYGPWAFVVDGRFAGWGGLQPEEGDVDLAVVLHPDYWGLGKAIYDRLIAFAFEEKGFESVTILLPHSRTRVKGIFRLDFEPDGETEVGGERFNRYRLHRPGDASPS